MIIKTLDEFLAENGAGRYNHEFALHHNRAKGKAHQKMVRDQLSDALAHEKKRDELKKLYKTKVKAGEFRPMTRIENLQRIAQGHEDNPAVQAARRILAKKSAL